MKEIFKYFPYIEEAYLKYISKLELKQNENTFDIFLLDLLLFAFKDKLIAHSINAKDVSLNKLFVEDEAWLKSVYNNNCKRVLQVSLKLNEVSLPFFSYVVHDKGNYFTHEFKDALKRFIIHFDL